MKKTGKMWLREHGIKSNKKDDYPEFVESMKSKGILEESFDIVFTPEEMTKFYTEWKIKKRAF